MEITEECDICGKEHSPEVCPELNHTTRDVRNTSRARATLPSQFVDINTIDNTVDVVAVTDITSKYHLGTFEANRTTKPIGGPNDFVLQIMLKGSGSAVWLDTRDENKCNWLCLIAVAATAEEKNVMALQVGLDIIYLTTREIHAGEALKVWYAPTYAKKINKPVQPDGLTKSMLILSANGSLSNGDESRQSLCDSEPSGSKDEMSQPSNISRMEQKLPQKLRTAPLCGKGIYVCAHPGCALIFPTQQRLDEHCKTHNPNAGNTNEMDLLMEDLKSENVCITSTTGGILQDVSKTSWSMSQDFSSTPTAATSTLDLIINPRALRICHQASSGEQQCRHCDKVFNSVEELAVHVKQHIFKGVGRKRKRQSKPVQPLASDNESDIDVISLNPPRKSGRSRKSKSLQDPDFIYVYETTVNTQRVKQTAASFDGGQKKHSGDGEQTIKRKRGRPPKHQRLNMTSGQKRVDAIKITDDKCGSEQSTSGHADVGDQTISDKSENGQPLHGKVDQECFTQSESMTCFEGTQDIDIKAAIKNESTSLNDDVIPCEVVTHGQMLIKTEIVNASQDLAKEKGNSEHEENHKIVCGRSEEFWESEQSADWQQQNLALTGDILVIGEQNLNIESCDIVQGQYALEKDGQALTGGHGDLAVIDYIHVQGEGQDPAENVHKPDTDNKPEMGGENLDAAVDKTEGGVNQNIEEASGMNDWNPDCLQCNDPLDGSIKGKQEVTCFMSDHGDYSMKTTNDTSVLNKSDADTDSTAIATSADNLFTSTNLVPSIVNLDDMDVITGESLSVEVKGECPDGERLNEGKAIINENKTHYLCVACQVERPLVSIKELHDHLYTHIGISKCPRCDELFVKAEEHECKASTKSLSTEDQPAKDSDLSQESDMLKCYEVKNDKYVCGICRRLFHKEAHLVMHLKRHSNSKMCKKCNRMFTSDDRLQKHECEKADLNAGSSETCEEKSHFCEFCGASYKKRQYLLLHMATHTKEHKCEKCGVHFARKETLMKHWTKCMPEEVSKKDVFPCTQCSRVFTKELSLQNHILTVHTNSFVCEKCKTVFSSMFSLKRHACMQQMEGKFECTICPKVFRRRLYLKRHMAIHSGKFTCILCQQHYARKEELLKHTLECSASIQFETTGTIKCTVCDKVYTDVHAYRIHYQDHTHPYKCDVCNKPFLRPMALEAHKKKCKPYEGDPFVCSICNRKFRSQIYLLRHKQVHDEKKYTCKRCNRKFRRIDYLNNHMCVDKDGHQVLNMQRYKKEELVTKDVCVCPHCGKTFQTTSNLNKHILLHGEKKEVCEVCGKKFHLKVGLREHMKYVHTDQYLIECKVCKKRLKSRNSLYGHMAVYHSDIDTVYPCEECGKTFRQKGNLKKHMLVHSENRLFNCKQCNKNFKFPEQLRRHELWHATGPRFFCDLCDKAFVMEFEIKKHLNTIHGGLTYICCYCDTDCHHFYSMKRHLQRRHMDKPKWQESVNEFIRGLAVQTVTVVTGDGKISNSKKTQSQLGSSVKKLFRCGFCKQIFRQQQELQEHLIENHCKLHKYHCTYCTHTCTEQQAMHKHLQSEHADIQEWQNDPDLYIKHLQDTSSQLAESKFAPESRSLLRDLSILKEESDVEGINPFSMTTETLDTQGILSQTMVSMATDLLGNVHQTLPQIDSLPLHGTENIGDMTDMSLDIGQEPVIVAEVKDFCAEETNSSQTIIIKGDSQDIELSGLLPQEVAEALQSISVQGGFTGIPVTLSSDNSDQGLIILPVMEPMSQEVQLTELQNNLKPQPDDMNSEQLEQLPQEASDEMKCEL